MYNNENKKEWEEAQMQIIGLTAEDVIATSPDAEADCNLNR